VSGGAADGAGHRGNGDIVQVGAGLGGALLSIMLGRAGFTVRAFEGRPDPRRGPHAGGRSINLALSARGLDALLHRGLAFLQDVLSLGHETRVPTDSPRNAAATMPGV